MKAYNFTKIGLCHRCFSENLRKILTTASLQNICEQMLRKLRSLFHFSRNILFSPLIWWNKICRRNKYHDENNAAHVHIQSNQKLLKIICFHWFLCVQTWRFDKIFCKITPGNIWKSVDIFFPLFSNHGICIG